MSPAPRIPFGSSLLECAHRWARLQLTSEENPPPTTIDNKELAIDRLIQAARDLLAQEKTR